MVTCWYSKGLEARAGGTLAIDLKSSSQLVCNPSLDILYRNESIYCLLSPCMTLILLTPTLSLKTWEDPYHDLVSDAQMRDSRSKKLP